MGKQISFVIILVIASFVFYWFQYRPSNIRKVCDSDAEWNARKQNNWYSYEESEYKFFYARCLSKNGLK